MIMGGMVLETSLQEIVSRFHEQQKIAKSEVSKNGRNDSRPLFVSSRIVSHAKYDMSHLRLVLYRHNCLQNYQKLAPCLDLGL